MSTELLSDVLGRVRLSGTVLFRVAIRGPWCIQAGADPQNISSILPPGTRHVIAFHLALKGRCLVRHPPGPWQALEPHQVVVLPRGGIHYLGEHRESSPMPFHTMLGEQGLLDLHNVEYELDQGPDTQILCGFLGCDRSAFAPLFDALPDTMIVDLPDSLQPLIDYAVNVSVNPAPDSLSLRTRLAELLFMESLRCHVQQLSGETGGWLAGLQHPLVRKALEIMHAAPARNWDVETLAARCASSRSQLAREFKDVIGQAPMHYLTQLRMQQAARRLADSHVSIDSIAEEVGYASSAAFQRAFKRCHGMPPGQWRRENTLS